MPHQSLDYLIFDYSEDEEGNGTWDAMASVAADRLDELADEIKAVLGWASKQFRGRLAPLDEGGDWDFDLQAQSDADGKSISAQFNIADGSLQLARPASGYVTVSLSLSGNAAFAQAFTDRFQWDGDAD